MSTERIQYFHTYVCFHVPHICLISNGMFPSQSAPKVLLDQNKETIFIIALDKTYIIGGGGGDHQCVEWGAKHRFCMFGIIIPRWLSKLYKVFATWFSTFCENFVSKFEKSPKESKKHHYLRLFPCPLYALFQMEYSLPKVLPKCSLTNIRKLYSLSNCINCIKLGENRQGAVWEAKHRPCIFGIIIPNWLSKIMWGFCNVVCHILCEFRGKIQKIH